ncbi:MAG: SPFH domain-containing protein [Phycisphaerales bacterium]
MKADYLAYAKAARVALLGLVVQVVLGLALLLYGILGRDDAAQSSGFLVLIVAGVWLALAIVFDQHRRERVESMEADTLAASAGASSVFESSAEEMRVAARRLAWMHRIMLPVVSVVLGLALIALGAVRLNARLAPGQLNIDTFQIPPLKGWALAIGLGIGVVGFVFARFVSGMAKQRVWANLRGGAGAIVGAALCGLAVAAAHFAHTAGTERVLLYLQVVIPGFMVLLGAEMILNLLLNFYRPRRAGEVPRPAFDSRVLSFVASPDRIAESVGGAINYQFGVDVTSSWAYKLLSRSLSMLVLVGLGVIWSLSCLEVVDLNQRAIRVRFGAKVDEVGPGLYAKFPWPFEVFVTGQTTVQDTIDLMTPGTKGNKPILWTNDHQVEEVYAIVQPTTRSGAAPVEGDSAGNAATGQDPVRDVAIVAVEIPLVYAIRDLQAHEEFAAPAARPGLVKAIAQREVMSYLATVTEDDLLGQRRSEISVELRKRIQARLNEAGAGVDIVVACVEGVHPPQKENCAKTFEKIIENQQNGLGAIEQGRTEAIRTLTEAVGSVDLARTIANQIDALNGVTDDADRAKQERSIETLIATAGGQAAAMLAKAKAERWRSHMSERGRAEAYAAQIEAYRAAPELYRANLYFDMLKEIMKNARVYIVDDRASSGLRVINDHKDNDAVTNALTPAGE